MVKGTTVYLGNGGLKLSDLKDAIAVLNEHGEVSVVGHCGTTLFSDLEDEIALAQLGVVS